ncbi:MAG TPA: TAXI family TRAP transporter solute-binding subunit [Myxococcales bacterium]|nr:TAXI family TRAP transporter solute-binding subunit [Myxococcales bacterium]
MTTSALLPLGMAGIFLLGHSPYAQWYAYRAKHLVVVTDEERPDAFAVAAAVAKAVASRWPESKAVAAVAKTPAEVVKLLRSGQLQVGLLPPAAARDACAGKGPYASGGKVALRAIAVVKGDLLVVLESFARDKARTLAEAAAGAAGSDPGAVKDPPIPLHPGALDYYGGKRS